MIHQLVYIGQSAIKRHTAERGDIPDFGQEDDKKRERITQSPTVRYRKPMMLRQHKIRLNANFQLPRHNSVAFTEQKRLSFGTTNLAYNAKRTTQTRREPR